MTGHWDVSYSDVAATGGGSSMELLLLMLLHWRGVARALSMLGVVIVAGDTADQHRVVCFDGGGVDVAEGSLHRQW